MISTTSLRLMFAGDFAKFVRDNNLMPTEEVLKSYAGQLVSVSDDPSIPDIIIRGAKCKFYGIPFGNTENKNIVNEGMIKVFSPKYIQVFHLVRVGQWATRNNRVFNNFVSALIYVNLYFVKNDKARALAAPAGLV